MPSSTRESRSSTRPAQNRNHPPLRDLSPWPRSAMKPKQRPCTPSRSTSPTPRYHQASPPHHSTLKRSDPDPTTEEATAASDITTPNMAATTNDAGHHLPPAQTDATSAFRTPTFPPTCAAASATNPTSPPPKGLYPPHQPLPTKASTSPATSSSSLFPTHPPSPAWDQPRTPAAMP